MSQNFIMILTIVWFFVLAIRVGMYLDKKAIEKYSNRIQEKACPPHRWEWLEQPGLENTYYMKCKRCEKTPRQITDGT